MQKLILPKKIIFFGTASFAKDILEKLLEKGITFSYVVSQPDRPAGRKKILKASPVKILAEKKGLALKQFEKLDKKALAFLKSQKPGLFLVAAYGEILPKKILEIPTFGSINVHGSLLPQYRGASPIQKALLDGRKETGVSLILMNEEMDAGPILAQAKVPIEPKDDYSSLEKKLAQKAIELLPETLHQRINKKRFPRIQDELSATFCSLVKKTDGEIDWNQSARKIHNRFRAFSVWPGIYSFWQKNETAKLKIALFPKGFQQDNPLSQKQLPGEVFLMKKGTLAIKTGSGFLKIDSLQLEGKRKLPVTEFIRGQKNFLGAQLKSRL